MKNRISISFIILLISFVSVAQKSGIRGGLNFSNLYVEDVSDENLKIGPNIGIWHRSPNEMLQAELNYSNKGAEIIYDGFLGNGKYRYNLNYLEVPLLFVGHIGDFSVHLGPHFGYLVGVNVKDVDSDGDINEVAQLDRDDFHTFDYGLTGGFAFEFDNSHLGLRYNYGLREIGKSGSFAGEAVNNAMNSSINLFIAFDL